MNKKGSHVGFMLSFVIFITFIVFLFIVFNPRINFRQSKELVLENLEMELLDMINSSLTNIYTVANRYNSNDYKNLKKDLGVPANAEFAFNFTDEDYGLEIIAEKNVPENINIYTKDVFVLYSGGGEDYGGFLNLKVW